VVVVPAAALARQAARAKVIELRFFGGLTETEAAEALDISLATFEAGLGLRTKLAFHSACLTQVAAPASLAGRPRSQWHPQLRPISQKVSPTDTFQRGQLEQNVSKELRPASKFTAD
jgi:ECF sigma factor